MIGEVIYLKNNTKQRFANLANLECLSNFLFANKLVRRNAMTTVKQNITFDKKVKTNK